MSCTAPGCSSGNVSPLREPKALPARRWRLCTRARQTLSCPACFYLDTKRTYAKRREGQQTMFFGGEGTDCLNLVWTMFELSFRSRLEWNSTCLLSQLETNRRKWHLQKGVALGIFTVSPNFQNRQHKWAKRRTDRWLATHFITFRMSGSHVEGKRDTQYTAGQNTEHLFATMNIGEKPSFQKIVCWSLCQHPKTRQDGWILNEPKKFWVQHPKSLHSDHREAGLWEKSPVRRVRSLGIVTFNFHSLGGKSKIYNMCIAGCALTRNDLPNFISPGFSKKVRLKKAP